MEADPLEARFGTRVPELLERTSESRTTVAIREALGFRPKTEQTDRPRIPYPFAASEPMTR